VVVVVLVVVVVVVVVDIVLLLTHNLSSTEEENTMKYENFALDIKNISKFYTAFIYPLSSQWKEWTPKASQNVCRI
jgi:hypothetical protein